MATKEFFAKLKRWSQSEMDWKRRRIKAALIDRWLDLTGSLRSTLPAYQAAMDVREDIGRDNLVFVIKDSPILAKMVEKGAEPWILQWTLLRASTRNIRRSRDGKFYLNVPFKHSLRGIRERGGNAAVRLARKLRPYNGPGSDRLPPGMAPKLDPYHTTDPLDALVRRGPERPPAGERGFMTWRRITENGRPWVHPGIKARNFMRQVLEQEVDEIVRRALSQP